jgi:hypothetical protein
MRVFNLTDVSTPALKRHGLEQQTIVVGTALLPPGGMEEIGDEPHVRAGAQFLVDVGAIAFEQLPPAYMAGKADVAVTSPPAPPIVTAPEPTPEPEPAPEPAPVVVEEAPRFKRGKGPSSGE